MSELPEGWKRVVFGDVSSRYISGGTPKSSVPEYWDGAVPWTTSAAIDADDLHLTEPKRYISDEGLANSSAKVVPKGSLLVGTRVGVGKAVVNLLDIAISQDLTGVVLNESLIDPEFAAYVFKCATAQDFFDARKRGATIKGVSRSDLKQVPLRLPPVSDQQAIVQALRSVHVAIESRRDELGVERERKTALVARLLAFGTRGEPTKDSAAGKVPASWQVTRLGKLIGWGPQNGLYKPQSAYGTGTPILRIDAFSPGDTVSEHGLKRVQLSADEEETYSLQEGDIVLNRVNGNISLVGKAAIVGRLNESIVFESNMMRFMLDSDVVTSEYVNTFLASPVGRSLLISRARHTNQVSVNQGDVKSLPVPVPAREEQRVIANIISACDNKIAVLVSEIELHEELFQALLEDLTTGQRSALPLLETQEEVAT